ncbi:MAG: hypothetical protein KDA62_09200, partial [Planctomycetales bacterium]|nr:hypothetical protein [Planctomycetales bacterium]
MDSIFYRRRFATEGRNPGKANPDLPSPLRRAKSPPSTMKEHRIGIILNGVTGRMGTNQHLV